jgi:hypothetical protein
MTQFDHVADLQSLKAAIAASPIVVERAKTVAPDADFAAWCGRQPADIDTVILDWLRAQARCPAALS